MALTKYKQKRKFDKTPEPEGGTSSGAGLRFVVQKHNARALHYDFRLEMEGVLKSWAVPKGPSLNPSDRRLAMRVEDHPLDYRDFEGIIPEGNYGAGEVIVWDRGTYRPIENIRGKEAQDKALLKQLREGSVKIVLKGKKLKGEFALVKTRGMGENAWLLIKHKDEWASDKDISLDEASVKSGKTLKDLAAQNKAGAGKKKPTPAKKKPSKAEKKSPEPDPEMIADAAGGKLSVPALTRIIQKGQKKGWSEDYTPMLATLTDEVFDGNAWDFEIKWDGYRSLAFLNDGKVSLISRNGLSFNQKFRPVYDALSDWQINAVIDGEIVAMGPDKIPSFNRLQNWKDPTTVLIYYIFDVLWIEGYDVTRLPLYERKAILNSIAPAMDPIRLGMTVKNRGRDLFDAATRAGMEGIIAKRSDSIYVPGSRSGDWLKIKSRKRQEVVIIGYTRRQDSPRIFSSLIVGVYDGHRLRYAGKVGTGFKDPDQKRLFEKFQSLKTRTSPVEDTEEAHTGIRRYTPANTDIYWLKPKLVCEIYYTEVTEDGIFRHPAFIALREDKPPKDVRMEKANKKTAPANPDPGAHRTYLKGEADEQIKKTGGHEVKFTNLNKVYWPKEKYTKRDMLNYYNDVAPYILPYLKNRPQSLNRFPDGIQRPGFFQKDVTGKVADWIKKYPYKAEGDDSEKNYMLCDDKASLLYMVNMGTIEVNPWSSTIQKPDHPSWCILDIDPDRSNTFDQVIEVAQAIKSILDGLDVSSCCKTSGSTGMHVYIPLQQKYTYDQSQLLAHWVAQQVNVLLPALTSVERPVKKRKGRIYIDFLQNRPGATLAAPYSLRPRPGATVSMPLHWEEVKPGLSTRDFTIVNSMERLRSEGDIFKPVLGKGIDLKKVIKNIEI